jgi:hypothetical protein
MNNDIRSVYLDLLMYKRELVLYRPAFEEAKRSIYTPGLWWEWIKPALRPHHRIYERYGSFKEGS